MRGQTKKELESGIRRIKQKKEKKQKMRELELLHDVALDDHFGEDVQTRIDGLT